MQYADEFHIKLMDPLSFILGRMCTQENEKYIVFIFTVLVT